MSACANYQGAPADCKHEVFSSTDGSDRCRGCHLHPDTCTCGGQTAIGEIIRAVARRL